MRFVKLTADDGGPVFVNPEAVERVYGRDVKGGGSVVVSSNGIVHVSERPAEAARLLEERPVWREVPQVKLIPQPPPGRRS